MIKQMTSEELKNLILHGNKEIIKEVLENIHPADILDILHEDEDSSKEILEHLPNEVIGDILDEEDDEELILEWLNLFSKYPKKLSQYSNVRKGFRLKFLLTFYQAQLQPLFLHVLQARLSKLLSRGLFQERRKCL